VGGPPAGGLDRRPRGYQRRGPAHSGDVKWKAEEVSGRFQPFLVHDRTGDDRDDFDAGEGLRHRLSLENRWEPTPSLRVDVEANDFSDRG